MNEMTPQECAERLDKIKAESCEPCVHHICKSCKGSCKSVAPLIYAATILRKLAASELVEVDKVRKFLESQLSDTYYCTRVWDAWNVGTMSENDFELVDVNEIMSALLNGRENIQK